MAEETKPEADPVIYGRQRRKDLLPDDYKAMNLGKRYWNASLAGIKSSETRDNVKLYGLSIVDHLKRGEGIWFTGPLGSGKTGAAATLAKEARRWGFSVYFTTHGDLQELRFAEEREDFQDGMSVWKRIQTVDLLVLDQFDVDCIEDKRFGPVQLGKLIEKRNADMKTTFLCTRFNRSFAASSSFGKIDPIIIQTMLPFKVGSAS